MGISITLSCPKCGGALSLEEGARTTYCPYCGILLAIEGDDGVHRLTYKNNLGREKADGIARGWMGGGLKARDLKRKAEITECYPIYAPFWKLRARAAGWVCGYREERREKTTVRVPMEKMVMSDFDWNEIACDAGDLGVEHLSHAEGTVVLHDEGTIPTFEVTTATTDATGRGTASIRETAVNSAGVPNKTFVKMHVLPMGLSLVFYPIWIVRYKYSGRMYFCTIDGVTGKVLAGRAPGDTLMRAIAVTVGMLVGGFGSAIGLILMGRIQGDTAYGVGGVTIAGCLLVAYVCYRFYRYGSEVTTGSVKGGFNMNLGLGKGNNGVQVEAPGANSGRGGV